jgi:hypothetical protein
MGTKSQFTPVWATTVAWVTYLGSSRLIAVSVTIVLIRSRAMIFRRASGDCQAPRIKRPGTRIRRRFSTRSVHQIETVRTDTSASTIPHTQARRREDRRYT